jgi:hypothetical protein
VLIKQKIILPSTPIIQTQIVNQRNDDRGIHVAKPPSYNISFHVNSNNSSSTDEDELDDNTLFELFIELLRVFILNE